MDDYRGIAVGQSIAKLFSITLLRRIDRWAEERRHNYVEYASPTSSERKKFVFNLEDDAAVEQEFAPMRRIAEDPDRMRAWFTLAQSLEPPRWL